MGNIIDTQKNDFFEEQSEIFDLFWLSDYHSQILKLEYIAGESKDFFAISDDLLIQLNHSARDIGMSLDDLIDQWTSEKLKNHTSRLFM